MQTLVKEFILVARAHLAKTAKNWGVFKGCFKEAVISGILEQALCEGNNPLAHSGLSVNLMDTMCPIEIPTLPNSSGNWFAKKGIREDRPLLSER